MAKGAIVRVDKEKYLNSVEVRLLLQCVDFWSSMRIPYPALSGVKLAFSTCDPRLLTSASIGYSFASISW